MSTFLRMVSRSAQSTVQAYTKSLYSIEGQHSSAHCTSIPSDKVKIVATSNFNSDSMQCSRRILNEGNYSPKRYSVTVHKRHYSTQNDPRAGNRGVNNSGWFNNINTGQIIKGGGILITLMAGLGGYLYCETNTDHELCDSVRKYLGIKKK